MVVGRGYAFITDASGPECRAVLRRQTRGMRCRSLLISQRCARPRDRRSVGPDDPTQRAFAFLALVACATKHAFANRWTTKNAARWRSRSRGATLRPALTSKHHCMYAL